MKNIKIISILLSMIFVIGCADVSKYTLLKSDSEIRLGCLEKYRESHEDETECADKICEELGLKWRGSGSWYHTTENCNTESGASIQVELCNTNLESCKRVCDSRIKIQECSINQGEDYQ